jgi:ATP-binding cassette, subfamily B, bacterial
VQVASRLLLPGWTLMDPAPLPSAPLPFLLALVGRRWRLLSAVLGLLLAGNLLGLAQPLFLKIILDRVVLAGETGLAAPLAAAMLGLILLRFVANVLHRWTFTRLSARILLDLRLRLLRHLQRLSLRWFAATPLGEILARANRDVAAIGDLAVGTFLSLVSGGISLVLVTAFMAVHDWRLFLIGASPFPFALLAAWIAAPRLRAGTADLRARSAESASFFTETLGAMRAVQGAGREAGERRRFAALHRKAMDSILRFGLISQIAAGTAGGLIASGSVVLVAVGSIWAAEGRVSPGVLLAQALYLGMVYSPLRGILELYLKLQEGRVSIDRYGEILAVRPEVTTGRRALPRPLRGEIRFERVTFAHRPGEAVLRNGTFTIPAGSVTALVGPSGIGKSTAIDLMMRFYDPDSGAVLLDGIDLRQLDLRALRRRIALAPQDPFIFRGTLEENVAFGRPGATRDEVLAALRWARIEDLASRLPRGLDEPLGESGASLSGGERQRISLARAVLRRPRILILDEATSALDGLTEREIREAVARLREGRVPPEIRGGPGAEDGPATVVLVTHRLPALGFADRILVLADGAVDEAGTHEELIAREGLYRRMYEAIGFARKTPGVG